MSVTTVPGNDFMTETHDEDDAFTTRSKHPQMPSTALTEEITANILRQAKERFRRRQRKWQRQAAREAREAAFSKSAHPADSSDDERDEAEGGEDEESSAAEAAGDQTPKAAAAAPQPAKVYEPVVSANDELSEYLLRPSVQHILSDLDKALTFLHNSRLAGLSYMTDSSASATDASDDSDASDASASTTASRTSAKRNRRGRPKSTAPRTPPRQRSTSERRGRPRKVHMPLPGESQKEMEIRIARQQKKRIPYPSDEENDPKGSNVGKGKERAQDVGTETERNSEDDEANAEKTKSPRKRRDLAPEDRQKAKIKAREDMLGVWGLRDWSDVIGAASIAGFKPEVVARAAQRCANLFGQSMEVMTLVEGPASKGPKPQTTLYAPNNDQPRAGSPSSSDSEGEEPAPRPRRGRRGSLARDSVPPSDSDAAKGQRQGSRARSTSRSSSLGLFFCPVAGCERAVEGFARRTNLQRHMALIHPGEAVDVDDVGSEDEMHGAVHVDGFLRPIRPRKGWRAEDTGVRKRKRHYRGRRVDGSDDSDAGDAGDESVWDST